MPSGVIFHDVDDFETSCAFDLSITPNASETHSMRAIGSNTNLRIAFLPIKNV
jgi:hypothetical protein